MSEKISVEQFKNMNLIHNNLHEITTEILKLYKFNKTSSLIEFASTYSNSYIEVYCFLDRSYSTQGLEVETTKVKINFQEPEKE